MAFSSIFKGEEGKPSFMQNTTSFFSSVQAKSDDLLGNLKKKTTNAVQQLASVAPGGGISDSGHKSRDADDDSSASEYGDGGDPAMYADEAPMERKLSSESIDSLPPEEAEKYRSDIKQFVTAMLS
ncbi:unnamed protein product [Rodentolepis nana]|uniref:Uncharacterized protein n=1 Tax=Rodentolepis nana TaxID=102285 RepID=A0A0R3T694_RODNA|nr:unnamed protein product [Rodentolepis nana]